MVGPKKSRRQENIRSFFHVLIAHEPGSERDYVGIVVLAKERSGLVIVGDTAAYPRDLVGRDGHALSRSADQNPKVAGMVRYQTAGLFRKSRIIADLFPVRPDIFDQTMKYMQVVNRTGNMLDPSLSSDAHLHSYWHYYAESQQKIKEKP